VGVVQAHVPRGWHPIELDLTLLPVYSIVISFHSSILRFSAVPKAVDAMAKNAALGLLLAGALLLAQADFVMGEDSLHCQLRPAVGGIEGS